MKGATKTVLVVLGAALIVGLVQYTYLRSRPEGERRIRGEKLFQYGHEHEEEEHEEEAAGGGFLGKYMPGVAAKEWGNPKAKTRVLAHVPDSRCHKEAIDFLMDIVRTRPDAVHLKVVRMGTGESKALFEEKEGRASCAWYEINGEVGVTIKQPDGSEKNVVFQKSPGMGWTVEELKMAVGQFISRAEGAAKPSKPSTKPPNPPAKGEEGEKTSKPVQPKAETPKNVSKDVTAPKPPAEEAHLPPSLSGRFYLKTYMGEEAIKEWGNAEAKTHIVAYIPEAACHKLMVEFLMKKVKENPKELYVKLVRMRSREGGKLLREAGEGHCAQYQINGSSEVTLTLEDGSKKEVRFYRKPGGAYKLEDFVMAVEQSLGKS